MRSRKRAESPCLSEGCGLSCSQEIARGSGRWKGMQLLEAHFPTRTFTDYNCRAMCLRIHQQEQQRSL